MDGYDSFINDNEEVTAKGDSNYEEYQGLIDSPEIDEIIDNSDEERSDNSYDEYSAAGVVLPDRKGEKLMGKVRKVVKYYCISIGEDNYNDMHNKYVYEF